MNGFIETLAYEGRDCLDNSILIFDVDIDAMMRQGDTRCL